MESGAFMREHFSSIDEYIKSFPNDVQVILEKIRQTIRDSAPEAIETISYQMPTFKLRGKNLVHFAGYKNHVGFYPTPSGIVAFEKELSKYRTGKGTIQFKLDQPLPFDLIRKVVVARVKETLTAVKKH
jgi:uncharacterized protein YdhG (YjbR/CyaY superfamily)